mmetsp:Transcript_5319/g.7526  ORF Transcript_5319/g.7526 Transcript_5319/m.7526 type:complete len:332 (+) Transcript_5319:87-1082(+)
MCLPSMRNRVVIVFLLAMATDTYAVTSKTPAFVSTPPREARSDGHDKLGLSSIDKTRNQFLKDALVGGIFGLVASISNPNVASAMVTDPQTGIALPEEGEIEMAIPKNWDGVESPFDKNSKSQFGRLDSTPDSIFYTEPRFVEHVDENAVKLMTEYISDEALQSGDSVLDLCSSWTSHIKSGKDLQRVAGLGMNLKELESNPSLTEWKIRDLNENPKLPYDDASFNVVLCQLSIDYLTQPVKVIQEISRVLKPGGKIHILFSNRLFLSKAVAVWTGADDVDHAYTVGAYINESGGFENIAAKDLSTRKGRGRRITGDPLYVVSATKPNTPR